MSHEFITPLAIKDAEATFGTPKYGPVGYITDQRTYKRWIPDKERRETFFERNARVVNYSVNLALGQQPLSELEEEADALFFHMNAMLGFPSGRTLWAGGTWTAAKHPAATYNCSFVAINRVESFLILFELLMLGCGVGFRVFKRDIDQLPTIAKRDLKYEFKPYVPVEPSARLEGTQVFLNMDFSLIVNVGDSREGWASAAKVLINTYLGKPIFEGTSRINPKSVIFNFNSVRPNGSRLKGFGGTASGPEALQGILQDIIQIFEECPTPKLRSIDCMDICNCIAKGVSEGSSRRSALISLFEEGDTLCANSKVDLFDPTRLDLVVKRYRIQANNTECIGSRPESLAGFRAFLESNPDKELKVYKEEAVKYRPSREWFKERFKTVAISGDPGFNNYLHMIARRWMAVREHRPAVPISEIWNKYCDIGTNPCHEIILSAGYSEDSESLGRGVGYCNLVTLPLQNFAFKHVEDHKGYFLDEDLLKNAVEVITRVAIRQTCVDMPRQELDATQKEERLLGVSATGWRKLFDTLEWDTYANRTEIENLQKMMNSWANLEATRYAKELDIPRPLLVTCIKPEGTGSKVFGSSDGLHWDWAPYYIRRIQMSSSDALAKTLRDQGFIWHPTPYDLASLFPQAPEGDVWGAIKIFDSLTSWGKEQYWDISNAVIFDFPMKSAARVSQGDVSAIEQLDNALSFATYYTDHMPSSTITVKANEWEGVTDYVYDNWGNYLTAAFLSYWSGNHPLLPYEDIDEATYLSLTKDMDTEAVLRDRFGEVQTYLVNENLMARYERSNLKEGLDIDDVDLASGACPVR